MVARNGFVASERPDAAGASGGTADTTDDGENDERDHQRKRSSSATDGTLDDDRDWLCGRDQFGDIWCDKHQRNQEYEAAEGVGENGSEHRFGDLCRGFSDFFSHVDDHTGG